MTNSIYQVETLSCNQQKWMGHYQKLCKRGQERASTRKEANLLVGYVEDHHIRPECMVGKEDRENKVFLTANEHFIAHQLLCKIFPDRLGLTKAAMYLGVHNSNERINNKIYSWIKKKNSFLLKAWLVNNHSKGMLGKKHSHESKLKISKGINKNKHLWTTPIFQFDLLGNFIERFDSISNGNKKVNGHNNTADSNLLYTAFGRFRTCCGSMWSFSEIAPIPINLFSNIKLTDYSEFQVLIGTKYFSIEETMIQYKISVSTIKNRCYDSKSYRDWIYVYKGFHHFRKNQWEDKNFLRTGSQGKIWVHLENKERWIDAHLLDNLSKDGWILGRSVKNKL